MAPKPAAKRGGARPGSGRKAEGKLVGVRLTDAQRATAERLGGGNVNAGVRAALDMATVNHPSSKAP